MRKLDFAVAVLALAISACAKGGLNDPSPTNTPTVSIPPTIPTVSISGLSPIAQSIIRKNSEYVGGGVMRFSGNSIRLYVEGIQRRNAEIAASFWTDLLPGDISVQLVDSLSQANISATYKWPLENGSGENLCGNGYPERFSANVIVFSTIYLTVGLAPSCKIPDWPEGEMITLTHEVGHALGVIGHWTTPGDVMSLGYHPIELRASPELREAIEFLYGLQPGTRIQ